MSTRFTRPAGTYDSTSVTTNMTKYRADSAATPKVAISSAKMDGDFNTVIDALNALDDDINGLIAGSVPNGSITAAKLASDAVTTAKILDANVTTAKIAPLAVDATLLASNAVTTAKILDANVTEGKLANAAVTANKLDADAVTTVKILDGNVTTDKIADDAVTYAKMQNVSATSRILGRRSSGAGDVEENTLSQVLDMVGSAADGDLLIRSGGSWTRLGIGSSGQGLVVSSGLPAWGQAGSLVLLQTQTAGSTVTNIDFTTGFSSSYKAYFVVFRLIGNSTGNALIQVSINGGSTWVSTNYGSVKTVTSNSAQTNGSGSTSGIDLGVIANNRRMFGYAYIYPDGEATYGGPLYMAYTHDTNISPFSAQQRTETSGRCNQTSMVNALRFNADGAGNSFLSGTVISLYGVA